MRNMARKKALDFRRQFTGKTIECLILHHKKSGSLTEAMGDNYIRLEVETTPEMTGTFRHVLLEEPGFPFSKGRIVAETVCP